MEDLASILIKLSQRILNVNESRKLKLSKLMLNSLDPAYFSETSITPISTFSELNFLIAGYYRQRFNEKIKDEFFYETQLDDRFFAAFKLIMDIALSGDRKEQFLNAILDMTQSQQNLLMQFAAEVVKREQFVDLAYSLTKEKLANPENIFMEEKFQQLKDQYREFQKIYEELFDAHEALKANHEKTLTEYANLKEEKYDLAASLGLHHSASFHEIGEKYRKDVEDFAQDFTRLNRELQQKNLLINRKYKQNQELIINFSAKQQAYQEKIAEILKKQVALQQKLEQSSQKQVEYRFQILRLKDIIIDLRKNAQEKTAKLFENEAIISKFNRIKKLHLDFRKVMVQNYRNGMTNINSQANIFPSSTDSIASL